MDKRNSHSSARGLSNLVASARSRLSVLWRNRLLRFLAVGVLNTIVGYALYLAALWCGIPYPWALALATLLGVIFNFFTTGRIVFENRKLGRIFYFFAGYAATYAINLWLLSVLVGHGVGKAVGQAAVLPFVVVLSFLINKFLIFEKTP